MASIEINTKDAQLLEVLKNDGVLQHINPAQLKAENGYIFAPCSDCDHFADLGSHFSALIKSAGEKSSRTWPVPWPGGALWYPKSKMLVGEYQGTDDFLFKSWDIGVIRKGVRAGYLFTHAPCAIASDFGLSLFDQCELLDKAKQRVEQRYADIAGFEVACFFHACHPGLKRRTRHFSTSKWREKIEEFRKYDYEPGRLFQTASV